MASIPVNSVTTSVQSGGKDGRLKISKSAEVYTDFSALVNRASANMAAISSSRGNTVATAAALTNQTGGNILGFTYE